MADAKTKPTGASVTAFINAIESEERRKDCRALASMMKRITGKPAKLWGPSIIGFDSYHYRYESGREGDAILVGFASRGRELNIYIMPGFELPQIAALLDRLGTHRTAKSCLYIKRLADIDLTVLEQIIAFAVVEMRRRYPTG